MSLFVDGGGWTLVGLEEPSSLDSQEKLKYLGWDYGIPEDLVNDETALIGTRLAGKYDEVRITWNTSKYIQFTTNTEIFTNGTNKDISISGFSTSEDDLQSWVDSAGGAKFCRAADPCAYRPGDTSWAVKPLDDNNEDCGCNSGGWTGRGVYYSGTSDSCPRCGGACTVCGCQGPGSFVGVKDDGQGKSGTTNYYTKIWVR